MIRAFSAITQFSAITRLKAPAWLRMPKGLNTPRGFNTLASYLFAFVLVACLLSACGVVTTSNTASNTPASTPADNTTADNAAGGTETASSSSEGSSDGMASVKRNFYFVFDGSGSMKYPPAHASASADQKFGSKIQGAKWAVHEFMSKLPADVNIGLFVFDRQGPRQVLPLGAGNREDFLAKIDAVDPNNATPLGRAIAAGAGELEKQYKKQLGYGEFRLIVITDGEATDNLMSGVNQAARYKIPIYTIGFDMGATHALRKHSVSYRSADSAAEVEKALEAAGAELDVYEPSAFRSSAK
jgi:Ca-activated chloride channel homolog